MPDALVALPDVAQLETAELVSFAATEFAELTKAVLQGGFDDGSAIALHNVSHGVPLALQELVESVVRGGGIQQSAGL